jgi:pilus assembly protein Flp/PilA
MVYCRRVGLIRRDRLVPNLTDLDTKGVSSVPIQPGDEGQGLVEFALILVLIAIVVIALYLLVEPAIGDIIAVVKDALGL